MTSSEPPPPLEPLLRWEDLSAERHYPSLALTVDDALIAGYMLASGEVHPAFGSVSDGSPEGQAGGFAPPLCTAFVRYAKSALGGRWSTGTLQLSQDIQSFRALRRGEILTLDLRVTTRIGNEGRQLFQLWSSLRDQQGATVGEQCAELMWWRETEFQRVAAIQNAAPTTAPTTASTIASAHSTNRFSVADPTSQHKPDAAQPAALIGPLRDTFSLARLQLYGELAAARDPIHVDPVFAETSPAGANIAQGKLAVTPIARLMHQHLGQAWLERGGFRLRLRRPVRAGETIEAWARPIGDARFEVWCQRADGERVIEGEAGLASFKA